jgi:hypothetical protein
MAMNADRNENRVTSSPSRRVFAMSFSSSEKM